MKYLFRFNERLKNLPHVGDDIETDKISILQQDWFEKIIPNNLSICSIPNIKKLNFNQTLSDIKTDDKIYTLEKNDCTIDGDLVQFNYKQSKNDEDVTKDGEPDFLEFDIHFVKNNRGIKLLVDITYGDNMACEFSIETPNKINIIHYTGIGSLYDSETHFGFTDESINLLIKFFNSFEHGIKLDRKDFNFLDIHKNSYKHKINDKDHLYTDESDLISFGNSMKESMSNDIILVINNSKPPENKYLPKVLKYLDARGIEYKVASSSDDVIKYNQNYNITGALSTGSDYRVNDDGDEVSSTALSELKCPILAMCFGYQSMVKFYGSNINSGEENCGLFNLSDYDNSHFLFKGVNLSKQKVSFCFHDYPNSVPQGFEVIAMLGDIIAGISSNNRYGLLFHPEELESTYTILDNFVNSCKVNKGSEMKYLQTFERFKK
jgi:GMP synthase-like glutamine amidotransferase